MIDITDVNLVELVKKVYSLSQPQGMGFFHFVIRPLTDKEASGLIDPKFGINMDYVHGRSCKFFARYKDGRLLIQESWYDHTDEQFQALLDAFGLKLPEKRDHGCACACADCKEKQK
jgi:hypothetical protein